MSESCRLRRGEGYGACEDDGSVTLVKSNAKALLTLRIKSALRSARLMAVFSLCS